MTYIVEEDKEESKHHSDDKQTESVRLNFEGGKNKEDTSSMFSKELDKAKGRECNLEIHNFHKNPEKLEFLSQVVKEKDISSFNNLSLINSSEDQAELKKIADIIVQNASILANLSQMLSGIVQILLLQSQNNESEVNYC